MPFLGLELAGVPLVSLAINQEGTRKKHQESKTTRPFWMRVFPGRPVRAASFGWFATEVGILSILLGLLLGKLIWVPCLNSPGAHGLRHDQAGRDGAVAH